MEDTRRASIDISTRNWNKTTLTRVLKDVPMENMSDNIVTKALEFNKTNSLLAIFTMQNSKFDALQYKDDKKNRSSTHVYNE